jgi:non-ribosomal peptide synthetase component E (peptide arylation enzyme)
MDVTSVMRRAAAFFANREAIVHANDRLTFAEAWTRGCRMANGLIGLGSYKKPGRVVIRDEPLPKTPVGKIKRKELREPYWKGQPRRVAGS